MITEITITEWGYVWKFFAGVAALIIAGWGMAKTILPKMLESAMKKRDAKELADHQKQLDQQLADHQKLIQKELDINKQTLDEKTAAVQNTLSIIAAERNLRTSNVYRQTSDVLTDFYTKMCLAEEAIIKYITTDFLHPKFEKYLEQAQKASDAFLTAVKADSLFIPSSCDSLIANIKTSLAELRESASCHSACKHNGVSDVVAYKEQKRKEIRSWKADYQEDKNKLRIEFQKALGIIEPEAKVTNPNSENS